MAVALQHPAPAQRQIVGGGLIERPQPLRAEMGQRGVEILHLDGDDHIAMRQFAPAGKLDQLNQRPVPRIKERAAQPEFRDRLDDGRAQPDDIAIKRNAGVKIDPFVVTGTC